MVNGSCCALFIHQRGKLPDNPRTPVFDRILVAKCNEMFFILKKLYSQLYIYTMSLSRLLTPIQLKTI